MSKREKHEGKRRTKTGAASMSEVTKADVEELIRRLEDPEARTFSSYEEMDDFIMKGGKL